MDSRSEKNLVGVHKDLVNVITRAATLSKIEFVVTEGLRTLERQKELYDKGASKTMKSRHLTGHAVDLAAKIGNEIRWDWPLYAKLNEAVQQAASELNIPVEWGGSWRTFKDGPHWQLPWKQYP